jgi:hypothetical protein
VKRWLGFTASLATLLLVAGYFFVGIMMGDCDPETITHANCEASRSDWLIGLLVITVGTLGLLVWAFFFRGRNQQGNN